MATNQYEILLEEIGAILGVSLYPDQHNTCLVKLENGLEVQFEMDRTGEYLLLGIDLGIVPPGQYREELFKEALRANGQAAPPRAGVLAFSRDTESLVLHEYLHAHNLNGEQVVFTLGLLAEKGLTWHNAVKSGEVPLVETAAGGGPGLGMFGMRP